jgi:hypothetical protein
MGRLTPGEDKEGSEEHEVAPAREHEPRQQQDHPAREKPAGREETNPKAHDAPPF